MSQSIAVGKNKCVLPPKSLVVRSYRKKKLQAAGFSGWVKEFIHHLCPRGSVSFTFSIPMVKYNVLVSVVNINTFFLFSQYFCVVAAAQPHLLIAISVSKYCI